MRLAPRALTSAAFVLLLMTSAPMASAQLADFPGACRDVLEDDAIAYGRGIPILVILNGEVVVQTDPQTAEARQEGPGKAGDRTSFIDISVPNEDDPIVTAQLLHSRVDLDVDGAEDGLEAEAWVNTRLAHLNVLDGLVTADLVKASAYARTDIRSAHTYTDPSTIVNLQVRGVSITDISPGLNITMPDLLGDGSYVTVYERIDHSRRPTEDVPFYIADVQVRMIHIHLTDVPLLGEVEVIVSDSYAHAETPTPFCGIAQSVEAGAYILRIREGLESPGILVGEQHIGVMGGSGHQQLLGEHLTVVGEVMLNVTETDVEGEVVAGVHSKSDAISQVLRLCIKLDAEDEECLVSAVLVRAEVHCMANEDGARCEGETTILELVVAGVDICASLGQDDGGSCNPRPGYNATLGVPVLGPIKIYLNQHERVQEDGYASLYVRAIRIESNIPLLETIIIGRAYASAGFENAGTNDETPAWDV